MTDVDLSSSPLENAAAELPLVIGQLRRRLRRAGGASDLGVSHVAVLSRLAKAGAQSAAELARMEAMRPQSMRALLAFLEERGLVERHDHPSDRRQIVFQMTPEGSESNSQRRTTRQKWLVRAISEFTADERTALVTSIGLLKRLGDAN